MKKLSEDFIEFVKGIGAFILVLAVMCVFFGGIIKFTRWQEQRASYNEIAHNEVKTYLPVDGGYHVTKESTTLKYGNGDVVTTRSLRFIPTQTNTFFADSSCISDITVWDYDNDGKWDRVFLCGYPTGSYGANAIIFKGALEDWKNWEWDPCPADKDKIKPFDACTIQHVLELIKIS